MFLVSFVTQEGQVGNEANLMKNKVLAAMRGIFKKLKKNGIKNKEKEILNHTFTTHAQGGCYGTFNNGCQPGIKS